jgi:putative DNA primase/helicase
MTADEALEIARLASLDQLDYQHERKAAAKALGCSVGALDALVRAARASLGTSPSHTPSKPLVLTEIDPWPQTVDGVELLGDVIDAFGRHVVMGDREKLTASLWALHCHVLEATSITPRLAATSVFPESGKTTFLKVLRFLIPRPLHLVALKGPTLFRTIEYWHPSMLLDECNNWLFNATGGGGDDTKGDIMSIIDAGHERGVIVPRLVPSANGSGDWVPHGFDVYGPLVLALIGRLPEQIDSRSIEIAFVRRTANQAITPLHTRRPPPELGELARKAARWGADHVDLLKEWEPEIPDEIGNRVADNWEIMLSIAEVVEEEATRSANSRPDYPQLTREAAIAAGRTSKANRVHSNTRLTLLADLQMLFDTEWALDQKRTSPLFEDITAVVLFSEAIVEDLAKLEERPWAEWGRAKKPLSKVQLARLLAPLRIRPRNVLRDQVQRKGYEREAFEKAWETYL